MTLNDIKKKLTDEQIISFIKHLGGSHRINSNNKNEIVFTTICHTSKVGNRKYKLYYYKSSQSFFCYTHCSAIGDIYKLTGHVLDLDQSESIKYVLKFFDIAQTVTPYEEEDFGFDADTEEEVFQSVKLEDITVETLPPIKRQGIMRMFVNYYCKDWIKEGIKKETMQKYDIKFSQDKNAIVIPHHSIDGKIVGIRVRNLDEYAIENFGKYTPLYVGNKLHNHQLSRNLYGLDKNKEAIKKYKKVQIFEGEKSVLLSDSLFGENSIAVAIAGSSFSRFQMKLLLDTCGEDIEFILCFDKQYNDATNEEKWSKKIERMVKPLIEYGAKCTKVWDSLESGLLEYKQAPIEKGTKSFKELVSKRIEIKLEMEKTNDKI
ncbi:MAG: hypothetical protein ACRCX8_05130 [Sarcina sp.]